MEGGLLSVPTCSILLGCGSDVGLFSGDFFPPTQIEPVQTLNVVGPGMPRLAAVDLQAVHRRPLSAHEAERWSWLIGALVRSRGLGQRLRALHFCIVGVGRTGSLLAQTLAKHGARHLSLIDPDRVELHNLDAMDAVTEQDLGRLKVEVVAEHPHRELLQTQVAILPGSVLTTEARMLIKRQMYWWVWTMRARAWRLDSSPRATGNSGLTSGSVSSTSNPIRGQLITNNQQASLCAGWERMCDSLFLVTAVCCVGAV